MNKVQLAVSFIAILASAAVKSTMVLGAAWVLARLLRGRSAAAASVTRR